MFRSKVYSIFLCATAVVVVVGTGAAFSASTGMPVALTADQDRQRLLDLLHITSMRPGADGFNPKAPNAANYDEARAEATPLKLPDPLKLEDGTPVTTTDMWWQQKRGEIADTFDKEVYGTLPSVTVGVQWKVVDSVPETVGTIRAITKHVVGHVASNDPSLSFDFPLTITLPANAKKPVPVVLQLLPASFAQYLKSSNWRQMLLKKGWGAAVLDVNAVQADSGEGLVKGVIGVSTGGKPRAPFNWGVLRAWGWGASRAMDYFESDADIDSAHVGIEGLSRYGKAALVAMAYDPRFVVGFIASSGAGGAKLFRRNFGENEGNLTAGGEYQWFAGNFLKYDGPLTMNDLPVDAHELIALCAPRPVFISAGSKGDDWVDPRGMFMAEVAAGPVYRLLGKKDLGTTTFPPVGTAIMSGALAFRQHESGHTAEPNWPYFIQFATPYLEPKAATRAAPVLKNQKAK